MRISSTPTRLLLLIGLLLAARVQAQSLEFTPYKNDAANLSYNLLFCDDLALYKSQYTGPVKGPWQVLFAQPANLKKLRQLANSGTAQTRLRILAFNRLNQHHALPKEKQLLGIIVEMHLEHGLKTLAAYQDLRVRYINPAGKIRVWETPRPGIEAKIHKLFQETQPIIEKIGPWGKPRLAPPSTGQMRLTFLVSDGIYFGQGSRRELARSPLAGPVLTAATELLFALTK